MGRKPTKCSKKCPNHLISFKAIHYSAYFSREVILSFCPPSLNQHPNYPTFNRDRKYYTSSFIHYNEQEKYEKNDTLYKAEHDRFCQEQLIDKSKMLQPKPRSKNQYCHVCKDHYDDYLQHVTSSFHKQCVHRNQFTKHIKQLIDFRFPKRKQEQSQQSFQPSEQLFLQKQPSLATVPSSQSSMNGQTIYQLRFYNQIKQSFFGTKGVFGLYCDDNQQNQIQNIKQANQQINIDNSQVLAYQKKNTMNSIKIQQSIILNNNLILQ